MKTLFTLVLAVIGLSSTLTAAERIPILFDVPAGLETYTGMQPITVGVPFPPGALKRDDSLRLVSADGAGLPGQFEVTATWSPGGADVRWLLVDGLADIRQGKAQPVFLEWGASVAPAEKAVVDLTFSGEFQLTDGAGVFYAARGEKPVIETEGQVRVETRQEGKYTAPDGRSIADFVTRVRHYPGLPFKRVYHTMIWQAGPEPSLGRLSYQFPASGNVDAGIDGEAVRITPGQASRQINWNAVSGPIAGKQLDGWVSGAGGNFAALRWPWQQFPVSVGVQNGQIELGLISPERAMSLRPDALAVDYVQAQKSTWNLRVYGDTGLWNMRFNGPDALPHLSPRGAAKTFELLVWPGDDSVSPQQKNVLAQHPVLAYADPVYASKAGLPSPMSPRDPSRFPEIEAGLERAYDWVTRENGFDGDYGTWTFGDIQWAWTGAAGYTTYRYWMNHGKGWSITPWALWLRSGDRRYWESGEANSRHCMDIDICHVPEWTRAADFKIRGGQYHYSALQMGYGPEVATFFIDSEYLPYYYYTTGYRRAWDVTLERAEALIRDKFQERAAYFRENPEKSSRHLYVMIKDLAALYEATWRPELREQLLTYLDLTLKVQLTNGNFPGVKSNHYLDQGLLIAARALPEQRGRILDALRRWNAFNKDAPPALWTRHALGEASAENVRLARAQTLAIGDDANAWRGYAPFEAHLAGPILRDWVVAMAGQADGAVTPGFAPLAHFNARLPLDKATGETTERSGRHVVLCLKPDGQALAVDLRFHLHNMGGRQEHQVRVVAPDGGEVHARSFFTQLLSVEGDQNAASLEIPKERPPGVYTLVLQTHAPVCAEASSGKVVHYMPEGRRSFVSPHWGGQAWFMPAGTGEVVISQMTGAPQERIVALDPEGRVAATSRITGTKEAPSAGGARELPVGEDCRFTPGKLELHSFVSAATDWHAARAIRGMKPWFSARREEWFDPETYPMANLANVLLP